MRQNRPRRPPDSIARRYTVIEIWHEVPARYRLMAFEAFSVAVIVALWAAMTLTVSAEKVVVASPEAMFAEDGTNTTAMRSRWIARENPHRGAQPGRVRAEVGCSQRPAKIPPAVPWLRSDPRAKSAGGSEFIRAALNWDCPPCRCK
jgi:hypothetical protein